MLESRSVNSQIQQYQQSIIFTPKKIRIRDRQKSITIYEEYNSLENLNQTNSKFSQSIPRPNIQNSTNQQSLSKNKLTEGSMQKSVKNFENMLQFSKLNISQSYAYNQNNQNKENQEQIEGKPKKKLIKETEVVKNQVSQLSNETSEVTLKSNKKQIKQSQKILQPLIQNADDDDDIRRLSKLHQKLQQFKLRHLNSLQNSSCSKQSSHSLTNSIDLYCQLKFESKNTIKQEYLKKQSPRQQPKYQRNLKNLDQEIYEVFTEFNETYEEFKSFQAQLSQKFIDESNILKSSLQQSDMKFSVFPIDIPPQLQKPQRQVNIEWSKVYIDNIMQDQIITQQTNEPKWSDPYIDDNNIKNYETLLNSQNVLQEVQNKSINFNINMQASEGFNVYIDSFMNEQKLQQLQNESILESRQYQTVKRNFDHQILNLNQNVQQEELESKSTIEDVYNQFKSNQIKNNLQSQNEFYIEFQEKDTLSEDITKNTDQKQEFIEDYLEYNEENQCQYNQEFDRSFRDIHNNLQQNQIQQDPYKINKQFYDERKDNIFNQEDIESSQYQSLDFQNCKRLLNFETNKIQENQKFENNDLFQNNFKQTTKLNNYTQNYVFSTIQEISKNQITKDLQYKPSFCQNQLLRQSNQCKQSLNFLNNNQESYEQSNFIHNSSIKNSKYPFEDLSNANSKIQEIHAHDSWGFKQQQLKNSNNHLCIQNQNDLSFQSIQNLPAFKHLSLDSQQQNLNQMNQNYTSRNVIKNNQKVFDYEEEEDDSIELNYEIQENSLDKSNELEIEKSLQIKQILNQIRQSAKIKNSSDEL